MVIYWYSVYNSLDFSQIKTPSHLDRELVIVRSRSVLPPFLLTDSGWTYFFQVIGICTPTARLLTHIAEFNQFINYSILFWIVCILFFSDGTTILTEINCAHSHGCGWLCSSEHTHTPLLWPLESEQTSLYKNTPNALMLRFLKLCSIHHGHVACTLGSKRFNIKEGWEISR